VRGESPQKIPQKSPKNSGFLCRFVVRFGIFTFGIITFGNITFGKSSLRRHYAECHYAECHSADCRGATVLLKSQIVLLKFSSKFSWKNFSQCNKTWFKLSTLDECVLLCPKKGCLFAKWTSLMLKILLKTTLRLIPISCRSRHSFIIFLWPKSFRFFTESTLGVKNVIKYLPGTRDHIHNTYFSF
jgi:hypothetical protein